MNSPKMIAVLVALAALTGCATTITETEYIKPECQVPPLPAVEPPAWEGGLLLPFAHIPSDSDDWRAYDRALDNLEAYDEAVADSLIEHRAMLRELCGE